MKRLNEDLKNHDFKQIYLLYGEEAYLKKQYKNRLKDAMAAEGDSMNYTYFEGKDTNVKEGRDDAFFCRAPSNHAAKYRIFQECMSGACRLFEKCAGDDVFCLYRR